jgi:hypothetical protein
MVMVASHYEYPQLNITDDVKKIMATSVVDHSSHGPETLQQAATVIGRSVQRAKVFKAIYTGKRAFKTVPELAKATKLSQKNVLTVGKLLAINHLVEQEKIGGATAYRKVLYWQPRRDKVLRLALDKKARDAIPTKRSVAKTMRISIEVKAPKKSVRAKRLTVDDIESFEAVRSLKGDFENVEMPETQFKLGVARILKEHGEFKDWGGEQSDLFSTRLVIKGVRKAAAFAFKGPGKRGRLTPGKLGKNGDQIQRLARCPAEVFLVQYWAQIDDSVLEQLKAIIEAKAYLSGSNETLYYGIIDGQDSARLIEAYKSKFKKR